MNIALGIIFGIIGGAAIIGLGTMFVLLIKIWRQEDKEEKEHKHRQAYFDANYKELKNSEKLSAKLYKEEKRERIVNSVKNKEHKNSKKYDEMTM